MKTCSKCEVPKDESEFALRADTGGLHRACRRCRSASASAAYYDNPAVHLARSAQWARDNRPRINKQQRERRKTPKGRATARNQRMARYYSDPAFRILDLLRRRTREVLESFGVRKSKKTLELVGCPAIWLQIHLGSLFKPGMTWENQGQVWHIDHIRPCVSFDLTKPEEQRACFHWTNLQPLFVLENLQKKDFYDATSGQPTKEIGSRCCQAPSLR